MADFKRSIKGLKLNHNLINREIAAMEKSERIDPAVYLALDEYSDSFFVLDACLKKLATAADEVINNGRNQPKVRN